MLKFPRHVGRRSQVDTGHDPSSIHALLARGDVSAAAVAARELSPSELAALLRLLNVREFARLTPLLGSERLADALEAIGPRDAAELLLRSSHEDTAEALLQMESSSAADVLEEMSDTRAADVLEEMEAGEAADVLEEMAPEAATGVLEEMEPAGAVAVVEELRHTVAGDLFTAMEPVEAQAIVLAREARLAKESGLLRRFLSLLGPGLVTGASDDDPSGIGTYAVAGATFGFATLWTAGFTFPLMATIQYICGKIGIVTGKGLADVLHRHYPKPVVYAAVGGLLVANTINAGADIGAIAAAINLLVPVPVVLMVIPIAGLIIGLQLFGSYRLIAHTFKWLTVALVAYIGAALFAHPDMGAVLRGTFIPTLSIDTAFLATLVAILGTTISPYLFFWQTNHEIEEQSSADKRWLWYRLQPMSNELRYASIDIGVGMFLSNLVMYFIILATGATLFARGQTSIQSAADAAEALRPIAGDAASILLAVGLIGTGLLAVPILTGSAAYAVAEVCGWRSGLDEPRTSVWQFYAVIVGSTVIGMLINFVGINAIDALFWTAVINGLVAPPLLILIMLASNNREILGDRVNSLPTNVLGWLGTGAMCVAAVAFVATLR